MNYYINPKAYFFWSGVRRISYHTTRATLINELKSPTPMPESLQELIDKHLDSLLLSEIQIAQPDIVLFLSTPSYDGYIKQQLDCVQFVRHIYDEPLESVARLIHPKLTNIATLRICHPKIFKALYNYQDSLLGYMLCVSASLARLLPEDKLQTFDKDLLEDFYEYT